jgi:hypothetical protein
MCQLPARLTDANERQGLTKKIKAAVERARVARHVLDRARREKPGQVAEELVLAGVETELKALRLRRDVMDAATSGVGQSLLDECCRDCPHLHASAGAGGAASAAASAATLCTCSRTTPEGVTGLPAGGPVTFETNSSGVRRVSVFNVEGVCVGFKQQVDRVAKPFFALKKKTEIATFFINVVLAAICAWMGEDLNGVMAVAVQHLHPTWPCSKYLVGRACGVACGAACFCGRVATDYGDWARGQNRYDPRLEKVKEKLEQHIKLSPLEALLWEDLAAVHQAWWLTQAGISQSQWEQITAEDRAHDVKYRLTRKKVVEKRKALDTILQAADEFNLKKEKTKVDANGKSFYAWTISAKTVIRAHLLRLQKKGVLIRGALSVKLSVDEAPCVGNKPLTVFALTIMAVGGEHVSQSALTVTPLAMLYKEESAEVYRYLQECLHSELMSIITEGIQFEGETLKLDNDKFIITTDMKSVWELLGRVGKNMGGMGERLFCPCCDRKGKECHKNRGADRDSARAQHKPSMHSFFGLPAENCEFILCCLHGKMRITCRLLSCIVRHTNNIGGSTMRKALVKIIQDCGVPQFAVFQKEGGRTWKCSGVQGQQCNKVIAGLREGLPALFKQFEKKVAAHNALKGCDVEKDTLRIWQLWGRIDLVSGGRGEMTEDKVQAMVKEDESGSCPLQHLLDELDDLISRHYSFVRTETQGATAKHPSNFYWHCYCCHLVDLLRMHGNLNTYSQQHHEAKNKTLRHRYRHQTRMDGCSGSDSLQEMFAIELRCGNDNSIFVLTSILIELKCMNDYSNFAPSIISHMLLI